MLEHLPSLAIKNKTIKNYEAYENQSTSFAFSIEKNWSSF